MESAKQSSRVLFCWFYQKFERNCRRIICQSPEDKFAS